MCVVVDRVRCDVRGACCRTSVGTYVRFLCGKIEVADDSDILLVRTQDVLVPEMICELSVTEDDIRRRYRSTTSS
jgi:hypothetical protein